MTKMAAMPIYGKKNPSKIFFSRTGGPISTKLGMKHRWLKHYNVYTVRILYNGERYNGIFDFRQKIRGDGFFPIKITTL